MNITASVAHVFGKGNDGSAKAPAPDALTLMRTDHREVDALFKVALDDGTPSAKRRAAIGKIVEALTVHAEMEEAIFYPALRKAGGADEKDSVLEAAEEHGVVKDLIEKIKAVAGRDETLEAKVTVLKELVQHHVKEEESTIFDEAKDKLGDERLKRLGAEMQNFKDRAKRGGGKSAAKKAARRGTPSAAGPRSAATTARGRKTSSAKKSGAKKTGAKKNATARGKRR